MNTGPSNSVITLKAAGVVAVLSGGAAISIYTNNRYRSLDLDFVTNASVSTIASVLAPLGFERSKDRYFTHPDTDFYVEFSLGPPAVGSTVIREWTRLETPYGAIQMGAALPRRS